MNLNEHRLSGTINVLIVDDHPLFREGLQKALDMEDDIKVIAHSGDGQDALRVAREKRPDVILLDVNLPGMNGLQVARQLKTERSDCAVVMLTAHHDTQQVLYAMRAGASAYCAKSIRPDDLVNVIRDAASGFYVVDDKRMDQRTLEDWINTNVEAMAGPYIVDADEHFIPLSPRETEILQSVTRGMSNKEIASKLGISQQTVKNHMTSILRKLNVDDRTQAAVTALRHGWVRIEDNDT
ncbi:response regulator transcription factor [bacterium]|nr:response regulator transcription factor [bacterium]